MADVKEPQVTFTGDGVTITDPPDSLRRPGDLAMRTPFAQADVDAAVAKQRSLANAIEAAGGDLERVRRARESERLGVPVHPKVSPVPPPEIARRILHTYTDKVDVGGLDLGGGRKPVTITFGSDGIVVDVGRHAPPVHKDALMTLTIAPNVRPGDYITQTVSGALELVTHTVWADDRFVISTDDSRTACKFSGAWPMFLVATFVIDLR